MEDWLVWLLRKFELCARVFRAGGAVSNADFADQRAAGLLHAKGQPLKQIAGDVGYASASAFSRVFTSRYGIPPSDWLRDRIAGGGQRQRAPFPVVHHPTILPVRSRQIVMNTSFPDTRRLNAPVSIVPS